MITNIVQNGLYNAFPGLCRTSTDRRVLVYRKGVGHVSSDGIVVCRKKEGINGTYGAESTVLSDQPRDVRDPEITEVTIAGGAKRLIVPCFVYNSGPLPNAIRMVFSDDDGDTWQSPVTCASSFAGWVACSGKVVQLASGDLLMPCYGTDATEELLEILRSTDYGETWTPSRPFASAVGGGLEEPNIALLDDGSLLMLVRTSNTDTYETVSVDDGVTWSALVLVTTNYGRPHIIQLPDGRVGMINRHNNTTRAVLHYRTSGVWDSGVYLDVDLQYRMTYASSFIDENNNWEIVVCQETSGPVSDVHGKTIRLHPAYLKISAGGLPYVIGVM